MVSTHLDMLEESLIKKLAIMADIEKENLRQKEALSDPDNVDEELFDDTVSKKGEYIDQLNALDDGFQTLFDEVKAEVGSHKELYADQIRRMQKLIEQITGMSASLEAQEHRNKKLADQYFSTARHKMASGKKSAKVAFNYYQNMSKSKDIQPQFLDKKN